MKKLDYRLNYSIIKTNHLFNIYSAHTDEIEDSFKYKEDAESWLSDAIQEDLEIAGVSHICPKCDEAINEDDVEKSEQTESFDYQGPFGWAVHSWVEEICRCPECGTELNEDDEI